MKKFLRRSGAALLAACTVWVVIATVESNSVAAAATALRDSFHLPTALMRLELGDLPGNKEMSLSTLLCLGQSPLLWAAYGQLPEEAPPAAEPQPVPAQPQPQPQPQPAPAGENEWTQGLSFTDNGAPSQTVIPTASKSYTVAGNVYIKNSSDHTIDTSLLDGTFPAKLGDSTQPQVLILHTHGSEAYTPADSTDVVWSGDHRTTDSRYNVVKVGDGMAEVFSQAGISVLHDRTLYDYPNYSGAYDRSLAAIRSYLAQYPSIRFILDIHRDAIEDGQGREYKVVSAIDGVGTAAQLTLVVGSDGSGLTHPNWKENLKLAVALQQDILTEYPSLMRPILLRNSRYNQHATSGSLLVEVGAAGNSPEEALLAGRLFAERMVEVLEARSK